MNNEFYRVYLANVSSLPHCNTLKNALNGIFGVLKVENFYPPSKSPETQNIVQSHCCQSGIERKSSSSSVSVKFSLSDLS